MDFSNNAARPYLYGNLKQDESRKLDQLAAKYCEDDRLFSFEEKQLLKSFVEMRSDKAYFDDEEIEMINELHRRIC